jgi:2-polyprenyl-6-methoxyphenol hydroxylase-like FAD-dependent oxidoreductase
VTGVLVVGAGIGGLTAALSMHAAGIACEVVDAARRLSAAGVGINLMPHAVRELTELGLGDELAAVGVPTAEIVHYDRHGNRIWGEPRGVAAGYRWPQYSIHRGELQSMLLRVVQERLGADAVSTGLCFQSCRETVDGVRARLRDRDTGAQVEREVDALVGADGLHSGVRAYLHPGEGPPVGAGIRMWRGVAMRAPFLTGRSMIAAGTNASAKFVAYPITPTVNGLARINWVAEVRMPTGELTADWTAHGRLADVLPHFADWTFDWLDVPALMQCTDPILEYPMVDRDPLACWGTGRVTLLGDAAHPMYPIGSNGGSQAILDARVLAYHLATAPDLPAALAGYERERRAPTNRIVLATREMGADRILRKVAERAPNGFERIENVLSTQELTDLTAAYRSTTGTDVAALNTRASWTPPKCFESHN